MSEKSITGMLRRIPFVADLPTEELEQLQSELDVVNLKSGEILYREGETGQHMYIVVSGELEILMGAGANNELILNITHEGEHVGEMSLLQPDGHRTTSVRAHGDVVLLSMSRTQFKNLLNRHPTLAKAMISVLSQRLVNTNVQTFRSLTEKNRQLQQALDALIAQYSNPVEQPATIFTSYARTDVEVVRGIYEALLSKNSRPWMDVYSIKGGENWLRAITKAIHECEIFLAVLSNNSVSRRGVIQQELKTALDKWERMLPDDIYIIPIRLNDCPIPDLLKHIQVLEWDGGKG